jgi:hypothetical protein
MSRSLGGFSAAPTHSTVDRITVHPFDPLGSSIHSKPGFAEATASAASIAAEAARGSSRRQFLPAQTLQLARPVHPLKVRVLLDEILGRGHALFSLANGIRSCSCPARRK